MNKRLMNKVANLENKAYQLKQECLNELYAIVGKQPNKSIDMDNMAVNVDGNDTARNMFKMYLDDVGVLCGCDEYKNEFDISFLEYSDIFAVCGHIYRKLKK